MDKVCGNGAITWDKAVHDASEEYKCRPVCGCMWMHVCGCVFSFFSFKYFNCDKLCFDVLQHNLCFDNCHSHVAMALNLMRYDNSTSWNMVNLCLRSFIYGKHVR